METDGSVNVIDVELNCFRDVSWEGWVAIDISVDVELRDCTDVACKGSVEMDSFVDVIEEGEVVGSEVWVEKEGSVDMVDID